MKEKDDKQLIDSQQIADRQSDRQWAVCIHTGNRRDIRQTESIQTNSK